MFRRGPWTRICTAVVLAGFLPLASGGCFGKFQLTRNLYGWNQDVSPNKWMQWLVFLGVSIIPVYGAVLLVDGFFANSVEFWTGDNPMTPRRFTDERTGQTIEMSLLEDGRILTVVTRPDGHSDRLYLEKRPDSVAAFDENGQLVARVGENGTELFAEQLR